MIDRDWDPGSQRKIGDRGDLWLGGRESKSNSSIGDSDFDSLAITLRGNPRAFHRFGRRIAVVRKWLLLGSFIWMQYPEDQSFGLQGMGFGIIETGSFASILESGKGMRGMNVGFDNSMLSRSQCVFHRLARSCRWKVLFLQPISSSLPSVLLARSAQTAMKFSLKGEPESRSTDDYWRFWDTGSSLYT
ncbi:hypothetical protein F2Q70_00036867 [Brassica cretica]|uniref:Uncharacterized protein n=1 Tax=Brassica cretica TaxID=69181 RepID=A0A8S9JWU1_BRACR|nr:hypothetical protein F2Q70_00036867 [Brassica cretica]